MDIYFTYLVYYMDVHGSTVRQAVTIVTYYLLSLLHRVILSSKSNKNDDKVTQTSNNKFLPDTGNYTKNA